MDNHNGNSYHAHDRFIYIPNKNLKPDNDTLYHLGLSTDSNLKSIFGDVKFVCVGGTKERMLGFANFIQIDLCGVLPRNTNVQDITENLHSRFSIFKVGPVLAINHGMGNPSISILLHEIIKILKYVEVNDVHFFRIGTCGAIGVDAGTVIITRQAVNGKLENFLTRTVLGKDVYYSAELDQTLVHELEVLSRTQDNKYSTIVGNTMCTEDFYEGQARMDGLLCNYTEQQKMDYLTRIYEEEGIRNFEMESLSFSATTHTCNIRAAVVCVGILNRLKGDQVKATADEMRDYELRPQKLVSLYIKNHLLRN